MELAKQFKRHLLNDELDTFSFFLGLSESDQKSLKPIMEELATVNPAIYVYEPYGYFLISGKLSSASQLKICASYLYNHKTFKKFFIRLGTSYYESEYYKIYRPTWLLNDFKENPQRIRYPHWLENIQLGLEFDDADIVNPLVSSTNYRNHKTKENIFDISHFYNYPIVLDKHIWLIFTEPSEVHLVDRYHPVLSWQGIIAQLIADKKIDRARVLKECLLTSTRNFNKLAVGWFCDLFELLEPTEEEIITLMPELMLVLNGTHTKPINNVLKKFKTLYLHADFKTDEFLAISEVLLASDVKAVINNTFAVFEKIAKAQPKKQPELCDLALTAFIHSDEKIQTKVAKFILKYGDVNNVSLKENIANYYPELFSSVKSLLEPLSLETHEEDESNTDEFEYTAINRLNEANRISIPTNFDDQIFFVTQAFENNEPYHFDVYLSVMTELIPQINQDNVERLAPAMKSAMRAFRSSNNRTGYFENMMAMHFVFLLEGLLKTETNKGSSSGFTNKTLEKLLHKCYTDTYIAYWHQSDTKSFDVSQLPIHKSMANRIVTELLVHHQTNCLQHALPMLSTPTHTPCFIDMAIFCERLAVYQTQNIAVNRVDFQVAISRLVLTNNSPIHLPSNHQLTGEYLAILTYLTSAKALDMTLCKDIPLWAVAIYRKGSQEDMRRFMAEFNLDDELAFCISPILWEVRIENKRHHFTRLHHRFENKGKPINSSEPAVLFHQDMFRTSHFSFTDLEKLIGLSPFKPSLVVYNWLMGAVNFGGAYTPAVDTTYTISYSMPILMQTWEQDYHDIAYLYLACVMTTSKKSSTQLAGEIWLKSVQENNMDNTRLGTFLGIFAEKEFTPLKRFTDLITTHLMNVSAVHNLALITLISNMIPNMNDTPIKGTKKLLELYLELLTVTKTEFSNLENAKQIQEKLTVLAETKSLKAIVTKLG